MLNPPNMPSIKEKKHRLPSRSYQGQVAVAFTVRIEGSDDAFTDADLVERFKKYLETSAKRYHCLIPIFCFMPDHLHVIFEGKTDNADAREAMIRFKRLTGRWLSESRKAFRWQKDFYDHILRPNEDVRNQVRYIANNPVRKKLVDDWTKYPHTGSFGYDLHDLVAYS